MSYKNFARLFLVLAALQMIGATAWAGDDGKRTGENRDGKCTQVYDENGASNTTAAVSVDQKKAADTQAGGAR